MLVAGGGGHQMFICLSIFSKCFGSYLSMSFDLWGGKCEYCLGAILVCYVWGYGCSCEGVWVFHMGPVSVMGVLAVQLGVSSMWGLAGLCVIP
jgi:hypothetical protein